MGNKREFRRISIDLPPEQYNQLIKHIPWGIRRKLYAIVTEDVIRMAELGGSDFLGAVLKRYMKYEEFTSIERRADEPRSVEESTSRNVK